MSMRAPLHALLAHVIDYAGLYPPAKLDLPVAFRNYLDYRLGIESFITGRFVCSATHLRALAELCLSERPAPFEVTVIGPATLGRAAWESALMADAAAMNEFGHSAATFAAITGYEIRIPDHSGLDGWLDDLRGFDHVDLFVELPWGEEVADSIARVSEREGYGVKARMGGIEALAFPEVSQVARFIRECVSAELPCKMTAGLHHPIRRFDPDLGATMHGFLNVLIATCIAIETDASASELIEILAEDHPANFAFDDDGVRWRDQWASIESIEDARSILTAFGSCSIVEPIEDLHGLGLIEVQR